MTATEKKSPEEVLAMMKEDDSIFIIGCGDCATLCQTGGEVEVEEMTKFLQEHGKTVTGSIVPDSSCQIPDVGRQLRQNKEAVEAADALLVLSCGAGVQAAVENV